MLSPGESFTFGVGRSDGPTVVGWKGGLCWFIKLISGRISVTDFPLVFCLSAILSDNWPKHPHGTLLWVVVNILRYLKFIQWTSPRRPYCICLWVIIELGYVALEGWRAPTHMFLLVVVVNWILHQNLSEREANWPDSDGKSINALLWKGGNYWTSMNTKNSPYYYTIRAIQEPVPWRALSW